MGIRCTSMSSNHKMTAWVRSGSQESPIPRIVHKLEEFRAPAQHKMHAALQPCSSQQMHPTSQMLVPTYVVYLIRELVNWDGHAHLNLYTHHSLFHMRSTIPAPSVFNMPGNTAMLTFPIQFYWPDNYFAVASLGQPPGVRFKNHTPHSLPKQWKAKKNADNKLYTEKQSKYSSP